MIELLCNGAAELDEQKLILSLPFYIPYAGQIEQISKQAFLLRRPSFSFKTFKSFRSILPRLPSFHALGAVENFFKNFGSCSPSHPSHPSDPPCPDCPVSTPCAPLNIFSSSGPPSHSFHEIDFVSYLHNLFLGAPPLLQFNGPADQSSSFMA